MKALIFAAGLGTRLKPFTLHAPKALYPLEGRPLIYWVVRKLIHSGLVDGIVVNVHHFADMIKEYLSGEEFRTMGGELGVEISDETDCLLETGGGMLYAERFLAGSPFVMHNSDIVSNADIPALVSSHRDGDMATLIVSARKSRRYLLFDDDSLLAGWYDASTGEVRSPYGRIEPGDYRMLAFSGIHVTSASIFDEVRSAGFTGRFSITDFYLASCRTCRIRAFEQDSLVLADAGKPENMPLARQIIDEFYDL